MAQARTAHAPSVVTFRREGKSYTFTDTNILSLCLAVVNPLSISIVIYL